MNDFWEPGQEDVELPLVHGAGRDARAGDAVDDEQGGGLGHDLAEALDVEHGPGGGLGQGGEDGLAVGHGLELGLELLLGEVLAPRVEDDLLVGDAVGLADIAPALAELAAVDGQDLVAGAEQVDHGGFHGARSRGRQDVGLLLGPEDLLDAFGDLHEEGRELGRPVMEDGLGRRRQGPLGDRRGAGGEEIVLFDHALLLYEVIKAISAAPSGGPSVPREKAGAGARSRRGARPRRVRGRRASRCPGPPRSTRPSPRRSCRP